MWTAYEYLKQAPSRPMIYTVVHIASVHRYHNFKPRGLYVDVYA